MTFYQELQLSSAGSKQLIKNTTDPKEKRRHILIYNFKVYLVMALQFLKQLCHEHGILTAGNTDSDLIALLHQFILTDCLGKLAPDGLFKLFTQTLLDVKGRDLRLACLILRLHPLHEPAKITSL